MASITGLAERVDRCWSIDTGWGLYSLVVVEDVGSGGVGREFSCDGRRYSLGGRLFFGPHVTNFEVGGRPAVMTMRLMKFISFRINLRRAFRRLLNPATLISVLLRQYAAVADAVLVAAVDWGIYELSVDGASQGSWIVRFTGNDREWRFSAPGGWVPDDKSEAWPA